MRKGFLLLMFLALTISWVSAQVDEKTAANEAVNTKVKSAEVDSAKYWTFISDR